MYNPATDSMEYDLATQLEHRKDEYECVQRRTAHIEREIARRIAGGESAPNDASTADLVRGLLRWQKREADLITAILDLLDVIAASE